MPDYEVLITGAGPTGLTAAICLTQLGIKCLIIDKKSEPVKTSNALGVQPRTMEIWEKLDLADKALSQGHLVNGVNVCSNKKILGHISLKGMDSTYSYVLTLPQAQTEKMLLEKLTQLGVTVQRNMELVSLSEHAQGVDVECLDKNGNKSTLQVKWVLGCDGTRSKVRELLKIPFIGKDLSQHFVMADLPIKGNIVQDHMYGFWTQDGVMAIFPMKNYSRLIAEVSNDPQFSQIKGNPDFEVFKTLIKKRSNFDINLENPLWTSSFWIHEHVVNQYASQRVFLLGDAAHEHSPVGGQGMNTGIQDAYNLCWKLAFVEKNYADQKLLKSYEEERLPIAKVLVQETTKATNIIVTRSLFLKTLRLLALKCVTLFPFLQKRMAKVMSELEINYSASHFVEETEGWSGGIAPGWRIPLCTIHEKEKIISLQKKLATDKYTMIVFTGKEDLSKNEVFSFIESIKNKYSHLIDVLVVSKRGQNSENDKIIYDHKGIFYKKFAVSEPCFYLVRPDQYVGFRCNKLSEELLNNYFDKIGVLPNANKFYDIKKHTSEPIGT